MCNNFKGFCISVKSKSTHRVARHILMDSKASLWCRDRLRRCSKYIFERYERFVTKSCSTKARSMNFHHFQVIVCQNIKIESILLWTFFCPHLRQHFVADSFHLFSKLLQATKWIFYVIHSYFWPFNVEKVLLFASNTIEWDILTKMYAGFSSGHQKKRNVHLINMPYECVH